MRGGRGDDERICARVVEGLALVRKAVRTRTRRRGRNDAMFMKKRSLRRVVEEEDEEQQLQRQQRRWQGRVKRRKDGGGSKAMAKHTKKRRSYLYSLYLMSPSLFCFLFLFRSFNFYLQAAAPSNVHTLI